MDTTLANTTSTTTTTTVGPGNIARFKEPPVVKKEAGVSVVIASFNEGPDLETTVAMCNSSEDPPDEIIVIDDCSDIHPVGKRLDWCDRVTVHRNETQMGAGPAKGRGVELSNRDTVIILDSHMRLPWGWMKGVKAAVITHPNSIFCLPCKSFTTDYEAKEGGFHGAGAQWNLDHIEPQPLWLQPLKTRITSTVPCVIGASYVIPRDVWRNLEGFNPNFYGWGCEEPDISLRAWLYGHEVRCIQDVPLRHKWQRDMPGYFMNSWEGGYNNMVLCATVFEDGVFEELFEPYLKVRYAEKQVADRWVAEYDNIMAFRKKVQAKRQFTDADLNRLCGYKLPTKEHQEQIIKKYKESKG